MEASCVAAVSLLGGIAALASLQLVDSPVARSVAVADRACLDTLWAGCMLHPVGAQSAVRVPPSWLPAFTAETCAHLRRHAPWTPAGPLHAVPPGVSSRSRRAIP